MKTLFCFITAFVLVLSLAGCKKSAKEVVPKTQDISFNAEITFYNESFECAVTLTEKDGMTLTLSHPEDISGLEFKIKSGNITATFNGLEYKTDSSSLPQQDIASFIYQVFKNSDSEVFEEDDNYYIEGKTDEYSYKLYLGLTGLPLKIEENSGIINVIIKDVTIIK